MSKPIPPQNINPINVPSGNASSALSSEAHLATFIKQNKRSLIIAVVCMLLLGGIFEVKNHIASEQNQKVQALFEQYLQTPGTATYLKLHDQFPNHTHTHLVALVEAKRCFNNNDIAGSEKALAYVINNAQSEGIRNLAIVRLSMIYRHTGDIEKAQRVFDQVTEHSSYTQTYQALSLPNGSEEKDQLLDSALKEADSIYSQQLINIIHYHNKTTS